MKKKYVCNLCGVEVEVEEGEPCPVCGADFSELTLIDDNDENK